MTYLIDDSYEAEQQAVNSLHRSELEQVQLMTDLTGTDVDIAEAAYDQLYADYYRPLVKRAARALEASNFGGRNLYGVASPEDLATDAFVSLWTQREDLYGQSVRIYRWLCTAVWRRAANEIRNANNRGTELHDMSPGVFDAEDGETPTWEPADTAPTPEEQALKNEVMELIHEAYEEALNDKERLAWVMRHEQAVPLAEIATALALKPNTVKSKLATAKRKLQEFLAPRLDEMAAA